MRDSSAAPDRQIHSLADRVPNHHSTPLAVVDHSSPPPPPLSTSMRSARLCLASVVLTAVGWVRTASECQNLSSNHECEYWAKNGECSKNPEFMHNSCALACNTCEAEKAAKSAEVLAGEKSRSPLTRRPFQQKRLQEQRDAANTAAAAAERAKEVEEARIRSHRRTLLVRSIATHTDPPSRIAVLTLCAVPENHGRSDGVESWLP